MFASWCCCNKRPHAVWWLRTTHSFSSSPGGGKSETCLTSEDQGFHSTVRLGTQRDLARSFWRPLRPGPPFTVGSQPPPPRKDPCGNWITQDDLAISASSCKGAVAEVLAGGEGCLGASRPPTCGPAGQLPGARPQSHCPSLSTQPARGRGALLVPLLWARIVWVSRGGRGGLFPCHSRRAPGER